LLAVMLADGVYLPLDASLPAARMRHMIEDAQVRGVLVDASSDSNLCFGSLQRINLDTVLGEPAMPSISQRSWYSPRASRRTGMRDRLFCLALGYRKHLKLRETVRGSMPGTGVAGAHF